MGAEGVLPRGALIVNADDFARTSSVNRAIIEAFRRGLISSTTLMATAAAFDEAVQLAHERRLLQHIGLHVVLNEMHALSGPVKAYPRLCDRQGRLCLQPKSLFLRLNRGEKTALAQEIRAQLARCRAAGIAVTHMDSHCHLHKFWDVATVVMAVARQEGVRYLRTVRPLRGWYRRESARYGLLRQAQIVAYQEMLHARLWRGGYARTQCSGTIDMLTALPGQAGECGGAGVSFELYVHPGFDEKGALVNLGTSGAARDLAASIEAVRTAFAQPCSFSGAVYHGG